MNNQLIPVFAGELSGTPVQLVDARLLHSFLEVGKDFSTWIKDRIKKYNFVEATDYRLTKSGELDIRGFQKAVDYHLSIDMAKELGMIERSDKGRQIRQYFLEMERRVIAKPSINPLAIENSALKDELLELYRERERLLQTPKSVNNEFGGRKYWLPEEDAVIIEKRAQGLGAGRLSKLLNRSYDSVAHRIRILAARGAFTPMAMQADVFGGAA